MHSANPSVYESIQHLNNLAAKISITCIRSSAYHWHYDYELIAVLRGRVDVFYGLYGPEPQKLCAGDVILINPKDVHGLRGVDLDNLCLCIQFSPNLFGPLPVEMKHFFFLNSYSRENIPTIAAGHFFRMAARIGLASRSSSEEASLRKIAGLYTLLADLLEGTQHEMRSTPPNNEEDTKLVMAVSAYIDKNLESQTLTRDVCRKFGISEKMLYLLLKNIMGMTPKEMIDVARIEQACALLADESIPMNLVSIRCGYNGEATFYRQFKANIGITPGEYRKGKKTNPIGSDVQDYLSYDEFGVDTLLRQSALRGERNE